jgi:DNA-binding MarR family transcriptional regulator
MSEPTEEEKIEKVLLCLSNGSVQRRKIEQELGFLIPQTVFEKELINSKNDYINLTRRGMSALSFLESVKEISALAPDFEYALTTLEKMEEELINLGFYDVITKPEDLTKKMAISTEEAKEKLEDLSTRMYVLKLYNEHGELLGYRSRIAEITRLISYLKQRFTKDDIYDAPNLVSSVKLRIKDRYVTRRSIPVEELMTELRGYVIDKFKDQWENVQNAIIAWLNHVGIEKVSNFQRETTLKIFNILQRMHVEKDFKRTAIALVAETGAGKTEAYFIPLMLFFLLRKLFSVPKRVRLIVVYPRVALSLNQLFRFTKYIYQINKEVASFNLPIEIHAGIDNESIPRNPESLLRGEFPEYYEKSWEISGDRVIYKRIICPVLETLTGAIKYECCREVYYDLNNKAVLCGEGHNLPIKLFKSQIYSHRSNVDVMIMTPNTLMRRLFENDFIQFLTDTDILVLVFDECHLYSSLPGAHMSLICRRLSKLIETMGKSTLLLGISATMSSAEEFFKELTGFKPEVISPRDEELERKSVEYYLFVKPEIISLKRVKFSVEEDIEEEKFDEELKPIKPLSTMIQTLMCVMHNMQRTPLKKKGLGFVDSIDTLHRWYYAQEDAEVRELFKLRTEMINSGKVQCEKCINGPIISCPVFAIGECWYFAKFDRISIGLNEQVKFRRYYSERREELDDEDCILTTSALEVGYDDPRLIAFFQYKSPQSIISFAQRKGRVARSPEDRPINVLVLNPYSTKDNFIFVNEDYILSSEYNEIPLNSENYYVQRDQAKAAIIDFVAYHNPDLKELTYDTFLYRVRDKIADFLERSKNEAMNWIKVIASIYQKAPRLAVALVEKMMEELT